MCTWELIIQKNKKLIQLTKKKKTFFAASYKRNTQL